MISRFADALTERFACDPIDFEVGNEGDFERRFAIPVAERVAAQHPGISLFVHPWRRKECCDPTCDGGHDSGTGRVSGCPKCWAASKRWGKVSAFGTGHTFDMVARDATLTLAVEIKLIQARDGRMPNGEIQRLLGQCGLAAAKHPHVIGLCAFRGAPEQERHADTGAVTEWFYERGVRLVFRNIP